MGRILTSMVGVLAAVAALAGCSSEDHNETDVAFATAMVEHHAQAIQMANVTIGRDGLDPRIAELAEEIRLSQTAEIDQMAGLLRAWGEEVPETGFATGDSHAHDDALVGGKEMEELAAAPGEDFAERWIRMMIRHHEGALVMIEEVRADGEHEGLRSLAEQMESEQRAEIGDLERWLAGT